MDENESKADPIAVFVNQLIEGSSLKDLEGEAMVEAKQGLRDRIEDHINAALLAAMPPEKLEEFDRILARGNSEEVQGFCSANIDNIDEVTAAALVNFRASYLGY